ncbi:MAG: integrase core domain-containing protein [Candidatus Omnitrophica bacterium]|nr:integrase core domain-containing protein [Candidatus Omnitrophota bacterium]
MKSLKELTIQKGCKVLRLKVRRYYRWCNRKPPKPKTAWNKITPDEENAILRAAKDESLCDFRAAELMVYGHESKEFCCSVSTVQRALKRNALQIPYEVPRRKRPKKPDIRHLMSEPKRIFSYDATEFYLTNRLRVIVIPILDMGSRKFIHFGVRIVSFRQKDVTDIWDEALWKEDIDTSLLTALSDRGGQMKGSKTKLHLIGKHNIRLEFARPYTPDDNAWIEAFIKYMKYHPARPDRFETVQDVVDWITKFQKLYNQHPHSSLGYVRPNEEHAGLGDTIRKARKENLTVSKQNRLRYFHSQKREVSDYGLIEDNACNKALCQNTERENGENGQVAEIGSLEPFKQTGDFRDNSSELLCRNR